MLESSLLIMAADLENWYKSEAAAGRTHSRVQRLPPTLFGKSLAPKFGFHGAETNGLMLYLAQLFARHSHKVLEPRRSRLVQLMSCSVGLYDCIRSHKVRMPLPAAQASW